MKKGWIYLIVSVVAVTLFSCKGKAVNGWTKTFGGSDADVGYSVQQTTDGGYIIVGSTESYGAGGSDVWLIKTDEKGNKEWDKTFGGNDLDVGYSVQQTKDGGFIIVGSTHSYVWLIKTDKNGNKEWDKTFGGKEGSVGYSVQQTLDGGYVLIGETILYGDGERDIYLIKTDKNGSVEWEKAYGGKEDSYSYAVQQTPDSGYIIVGKTESYGAGKEDIWLIKTDKNGKVPGKGVCREESKY